MDVSVAALWFSRPSPHPRRRATARKQRTVVTQCEVGVCGKTICRVSTPFAKTAPDITAPVFGGHMCGLFSSNKVTSEAVACRNGSIRKGDRVQTQYEREEGGDDRWYCGGVVEAYTNGKVR